MDNKIQLSNYALVSGDLAVRFGQETGGCVVRSANGDVLQSM